MNFLKEFRDLSASVCIQKEKWKGDRWWEKDDNPVLTNPDLSIHTRQVEEDDEGINEPGTHQQTALVMPGRIVVITGKKIEIFDVGAGMLENAPQQDEEDSDLPIQPTFPVE